MDKKNLSPFYTLNSRKMSIMQGATRDFHVDKRFTALEIIGGYDCTPDMPSRRPDLTVNGGMRVMKTACLEGPMTLIKGDGTIEGNLTVLQNSYFGNVFAEKMFFDQLGLTNLDLAGNLSADNIVGNSVTISSDAVVGGKVTAQNMCTQTLQVLGKVTVDDVCGNTLTVNQDAEFLGNLIGGQAVAGGYGTAAGTDAGVTIADNVLVFHITAGTETGAFLLSEPVARVPGQVVHVYNGSGQPTTGVVTASGAGATLVSDGTSWFVL